MDLSNLSVGDLRNLQEQIKQEILTLPLYPSMSIAQQRRVINAVCSFFEKS